MVKAHAQRLYGLYNSHGYVALDSISTRMEDVEEYVTNTFAEMPVNWNILEITVTPHVPATPRKEEE